MDTFLTSVSLCSSGGGSGRTKNSVIDWGLKLSK